MPKLSGAGNTTWLRIERNDGSLGAALGDVDVVHAGAVEPEVDAILVGLVAEVARERFLSRMSTKMTFEVVRLGVPAAANRTLKRLFARVRPYVYHEALLVRERLAARGTDVRPCTAVRAPVLPQHRLRQERRAAFIADERPVSAVQASVLR